MLTALANPKHTYAGTATNRRIGRAIPRASRKGTVWTRYGWGNGVSYRVDDQIRGGSGGIREGA